MQNFGKHAHRYYAVIIISVRKKIFAIRLLHFGIFEFSWVAFQLPRYKLIEIDTGDIFLSKYILRALNSESEFISQSNDLSSISLRSSSMLRTCCPSRQFKKLSIENSLSFVIFFVNKKKKYNQKIEIHSRQQNHRHFEILVAVCVYQKCTQILLCPRFDSNLFRARNLSRFLDLSSSRVSLMSTECEI